MLAYSIALSAVAAGDAPGTPASSRPAGRAGRARTTRVRGDLLRRRGGANGQPPAGGGPGQLPDRRAGPDDRAGGPGQHGGQRAQSAGQRGEHRRPFRRRGSGLARALRLRRSGQQGCRGLGQRAVRRRRLGQRAEGRGEGQFLRPARVDTTEQRIDQPVDHLGPEPGPDVGGDGRVTVPRRGRPVQVLAGPGQPLIGQHPGASQVTPGGQVRGHAHELALRQRPHGTPGPDGRGRGPGRHELVAEADVR